MPDLIDENYDICQIRDYRQIQKEIQINKMSKLRKEIKFLERGMQGVRAKLRRLQQDPTQTSSTLMIGFKTKTTWRTA